MVAAGGEARGRYERAEERRRGLGNLASAVDEHGAVEIGDVEDKSFLANAGTVALRVYSPLGEKRPVLPGLVFFHGGGWVAGNLETHDGFCRRLANEGDCRVIAVDYPLAPEHPFPQGLVDGFVAFAHIAGNPENFGIDPTRLGIAGDSAGGTLAAAICRMARDAGGPNIAFQLLICPILDIHQESASRRELADGYFLNRETLLRDLELYCPGWDRADPRLSPVLADDCSGLPPAYIHTAQFDPFCDEGEAYAARLSDAGVTVNGLCHPGMIHYFYCMPRVIPYAQQAARMMGAEIRYAVKRPAEPDRRTQKRIRPAVTRA
jgi:acetyl esterase/lipase